MVYSGNMAAVLAAAAADSLESADSFGSVVVPAPPVVAGGAGAAVSIVRERLKCLLRVAVEEEAEKTTTKTKKTSEEVEERALSVQVAGLDRQCNVEEAMVAVLRKWRVCQMDYETVAAYHCGCCYCLCCCFCCRCCCYRSRSKQWPEEAAKEESSGRNARQTSAPPPPMDRCKMKDKEKGRRPDVYMYFMHTILSQGGKYRKGSRSRQQKGKKQSLLLSIL